MSLKELVEMTSISWTSRLTMDRGLAHIVRENVVPQMKNVALQIDNGLRSHTHAATSSVEALTKLLQRSGRTSIVNVLVHFERKILISTYAGFE